MTPSPVSVFYTKQNGMPDTTDCDLDILELLPTFRPAVYQEPQLFEGKARPSPEVTRHAELERRRRREDRVLFEELSRYYKLPLRQKKWRRPELLKKGKPRPSLKTLTYRSPASLLVLRDLDDHPHLVTPPTEPTASADT